MLHHLAGATTQIANKVNLNCHPQVDGNNAIYINSLENYKGVA